MTTTYTIAATGSPGIWNVWYSTAGWGHGFNGMIHDCLTAQDAVRAQEERCRIFGWSTDDIRVKQGQTWSGAPQAWIQEGC